MAKNYNKSDYALNEFSDALVYSGADGAYELSKEAFLASAPALTEADYDFWKQHSDNDYLDAVRRDTFEGKHTVSLDEIEDTALISTESTEDTVLEGMEPTPNPYTIENAMHILDAVHLTDVQRERFFLHYQDGLSTYEIAENAGIAQRSVMDSLEQAQKKILKYFLKTTS